MSTVVLNAPMDFDISAPSPAFAPSSPGGMDFDLNASSSVVIPAAGGALADLGGMDFDISTPQGVNAEPAMDLSGISLDMSAAEGANVADTVVFASAETPKDEHWQEVENKLDLAKAFLTGMGDVDTARELLGEVLNEGDAQQIETARSLIQQI
jgi:pilus assembly protein FimV